MKDNRSSIRNQQKYMRAFFKIVYVSLSCFIFVETSPLQSQDFWEEIFVPDTLGIQCVLTDSNSVCILGQAVMNMGEQDYTNHLIWGIHGYVVACWAWYLFIGRP